MAILRQVKALFLVTLLGTGFAAQAGNTWTQLLTDTLAQNPYLSTLIGGGIIGSGLLAYGAKKAWNTLQSLQNELRQTQQKLTKSEQELQNAQEINEKLKKDIENEQYASDITLHRLNDTLEQLSITSNELINASDAIQAIAGGENKEHPYFKSGILNFQGQEQNINILDESLHDQQQHNLKNLEITQQEKLLFKDYRFERKLFKPNFIKNGKILFVCVHGTFSDNKSFGANPDHKILEEKDMRKLVQEQPELIKKTTKALWKDALKLATINNCAVELISFNWSGSFDPKHRLEAGKVLGNYLAFRQKNEEEIKGVWTFAHSHGCNVVNNCAEHLDQPFDCSIYVAPIALDKPDAKASRRALCIWGALDTTQAIGSFFNSLSFERKPQFVTEHENAITHICLKENGQDLNHVDIKLPAAEHLFDLIYSIDSKYPTYFDLDANVCDKKKPLLAIRHKDAATQPSAIALARSAVAQETFKQLYSKDFSAKGWSRYVIAPLYELQAAHTPGQ